MLTFAPTSHGDLVIATPRGLWIADHRPTTAGVAGDDPPGRLLAWEFILTARWTGDVLAVTPAQEVAPQIMSRLPTITLPLPDPADLPRVVHQRVDRSVAVSHRRALSAQSTVLLVGRRVSGRDGLLWYAVFDRDSDAGDPTARSQATTLLGSAAAAQAPPGPDAG